MAGAAVFGETEPEGRKGSSRHFPSVKGPSRGLSAAQGTESTAQSAKVLTTNLSAHSCVFHHAVGMGFSTVALPLVEDTGDCTVVMEN